MKRGEKGAIVGAVGMAALGLLGVAAAAGQAGPAGGERPQLAEEVFRDVQLLRGIPVKEFMGTMGFFSASTSYSCEGCHGEASAGNWDRYADNTELKQAARRMIVIVNTINQSFFGGQRVVTCYSCHRGANRPLVIPDLTEQYGTPVIREPDEILEQAAGEPSPEEILDRYIEAIGGARRLAGLTSFVARGTYQGYDDYAKYPVEIHARAPGQRATIVHAADGERRWIVDGRNGWFAAPREVYPLPVVPLTGGELEGAKLEAELAFPARLKEMLVEWRVGLPAILDDREVQVVQGRRAPGGLPIKLYFDPMTGLLVRLVYYEDTPVGRIPTQIDYADYREVGGIRMPFQWTTTWTDGRSLTELTAIEVNVPVETSRFARPDPPGRN